MARMIPEHGPHKTDSRGERNLYSILKSDLPEDYTVIHSLPWLCSAVTALDPNAKPTGEIDFLIIHPENGLLALEVKSGVYRVENSVFVHVRGNYAINPISQTRKNIHGLATWLGTKPSLRLRIGYGFIFPDSDFREIPISPGMYDTTAHPPQPLYIDYTRMPDVAQHIIQLMIYWKSALSNSVLGSTKVEELIGFLTPTIDGLPQWGNRILFDNKVWLKLTSEQSNIVHEVLKRKTSLITGWPGTGKTLIAIESARKLSMEDKRVLVISFNNRLTEYIRGQLAEYKSCKVSTWHALCRQAAKKLGHSDDRENWYKIGCGEDLKEAIEKYLMGEYDALIVDESQALTLYWCHSLTNWFEGKTQAFFCDETQVFPFERDTVSLIELSKVLGVDPFSLTIILRMPKAVTEILSEVVPPKLQHFSPRTLEQDEAQEVITLTPCEDLMRTRRELINEGVCCDDIIILTGSLFGRYSRFLSREKLPSETIGKFRGLEAPIILILGAEQLGTSELFSAYSRATSKCIVFYNAHKLYWNGDEGFQARLQSKPDSYQTLKNKQLMSRIKNLIDSSTDTKELKLNDLMISWAIDWKAWLIEIDKDYTYVRLWLEYLSRKWVRPIYFWEKDTSTALYQATVSSNDEQMTINNTRVFLQNCEVCGYLTPHTYEIINEYSCTLCFAKDSALEHDETSTIHDMDKLIRYQHTTKDFLKLRAELPIPIAAAAAFIHAKQKNGKRNNVLDLPLPSGRHIYIIAFVFAQSRIAICKHDSVISVNDLADEIYERYSAFEGTLSLLEWRKVFANAMGTLFSKGYLDKVGKGLYKAVEDDRAPVVRNLHQLS